MQTNPTPNPATITVTIADQPYCWICTFPDGEPYVAVVELTATQRSCDALVCLLAWPPPPETKQQHDPLWTAEFFWPIAGFDSDQGIAAITAAGHKPPAATFDLADLMRQSEDALAVLLNAAQNNQTRNPKPKPLDDLDAWRQSTSNQFQNTAVTRQPANLRNNS